MSLYTTNTINDLSSTNFTQLQEIDTLCSGNCIVWCFHAQFADCQFRVRGAVDLAQFVDIQLLDQNGVPIPNVVNVQAGKRVYVFLTECCVRNAVDLCYRYYRVHTRVLSGLADVAVTTFVKGHEVCTALP